MTAAAEDEVAKHKLRDEYIMHYKKEYDYYVEHYKQELEKMAPGETIDLKPYHYETPPAPVVTEAPKSDEEDAPPPPAEEAPPTAETKEEGQVPAPETQAEEPVPE